VTPLESLELLDQYLTEAGFDTRRPLFSRFWLAFKKWSCVAVDCEADLVLISSDYDESNRFQSIEFCRDFSHNRDDFTFTATMRFHSSREDVPHVSSLSAKSNRQSTRHDSLTRLEYLPGFQAVEEFPNWEFEGYQE
jgi:hypothetical protein